MKKISLSLIIAVLLTLGLINGTARANAIPTISIQGVTEDEIVTVKTTNFPASKDFEVRMGEFGTKGVDGILVDTINSGGGGSLQMTFEIPSELQSEDRIAIRLESEDGVYFAYNWFYNNTFGSHEESVPAKDPSSGAVLSVASVKKDTYVIMKGNNFPEDETFTVTVGEFGTEGVDGVQVGRVSPGSDGSFIDIFSIPGSLASEDRIAIRFESEDSDLVLHTWFSNETGTGSTGGTDAYTGIPTISIRSVVEDEEVTVMAHNFPSGRAFKVLMGEMGTKGIDGIHLTTIDSGDGGSFTETFDIPEALQGNYQIAIRLQTDDGRFFAYNWFYNNTATDSDGTPDGYTGIPTFLITEVETDETVSIKTNNFPADYDFRVLMGEMGTRGIDGILVTTINSGDGGTFTETFDIPEALAGDYRIAIRLEATEGGFFAYNWFYNDTAANGDGTADGYTGIPTFSISAVDAGDSVTIKTSNFPAGYDFEVLMGEMGTRGIDGILVTTIDSGDGGSFSETFEIPEELADRYQIAIRLEATSGGFFAYNWFYNVTSP